MKQLEPLYDRIVVRVLTDSERKVGSLYIPDVAKEKPQIAVVIAVGPGEWCGPGTLPLDIRPLALAVGDLVLFNRYAGSEVTVEDKEYLILREADVLARVVDAEKVEGVELDTIVEQSDPTPIPVEVLNKPRVVDPLITMCIDEEME